MPVASESDRRLKSNRLVRVRTVDAREERLELARDEHREQEARTVEQEMEDIRIAEQEQERQRDLNVVRGALSRLTLTPEKTIRGFVNLMSDPQYRDGAA